VKLHELYFSLVSVFLFSESENGANERTSISDDEDIPGLHLFLPKAEVGVALHGLTCT